MAVAFADCASFGARERDSAPTRTSARSGAMRTVPSPCTTTTGTSGPGGVCADPAAAAARTHTAATITRGMDCAPSPRVDHTEADAVGVGIGRDRVAMGAAQLLDVVRNPLPPAQYAEHALGRSAGIPLVAIPVGLGAVPVGHPLPHVAGHVVELAHVCTISGERS